PENNSPQKPAKPSKPAKPAKPAAPQGGNQAPATGGDTNRFQWIALAFISGGLLAGTLLFKKRILK
ncbi:MAG: hypothetical protein IJN82_06535, partial [Clostridia bacterium]|nr:hypothetical protein [Clostridia bacterium]